MADPRGVIIPLIILGFIFFSPDPGRPPSAPFDPRPRIEDVIGEERRSLAVLQSSTYSHGSSSNSLISQLNLTGLEADRGYAWEALGPVQALAQKHMSYALGDWWRQALEGAPRLEDIRLYNNVTGYLHGSWISSKLPETVAGPQLNMSEYRPEGPFGPLAARPFGRNVTGEQGDVRIRFHENQPSSGRSSEPEESNVTMISAEMTLQDSSTSDEWQLELHGVYFLEFGQAVMTTTSDKFAGIFMLPHFVMSAHTFEMARSVVNDSITEMINRQEDDLVGSEPWSSKVEGSGGSPYETPQCDLILYFQQLAPVGSTSAYTSKILSFLERELRFPSGAFIPSAPELRFSVVAFSPDCGYLIESKGAPDHVPQEGNHLTGAKIEVLYRNGRHHLLVFTLALGLQLYLLMRQMREASTPSTRSRISFYAIAMLSLGDGFTTMAFLLISVFIAGLWVNLIGTAFLAFTGVSFFAMRFMMEIWAVQAPERARREREEAEEERQRQERIRVALERIRAERLATTQTTSTADRQPVVTSDPPVDRPAEPAIPPQPLPDSLPLPATAQRPTDTGATPVFMPSDQEGLQPTADPTAANQPMVTTEQRSRSFGYMYARFYLLLLAILFVSLNAASWPEFAKRFYFTLLALIYLSFWIPQIHRNVQRNCRRALNWEFVLGQSVLRLVPFAYFYGYKHNVLFAKVDLRGLAILAFWMWIQVVVLGSQELIGPRWFIQKDWAPPAYDYHPVLREDEEGATMPIGFSQATQPSAPSSPVLERRHSSLSARRGSIVKETKERGKRVFDCAICMQDLEVPVIEAGSSSDTLAGGLLARRNYMVTPCRHIFHSACLEGWMKYRLQCPICRETLPPL